MSKVVLHSYWRSSCSWRVRIALYTKKIDFEYQAVNLLNGEQMGEEFKEKFNSLGNVPVLQIDDVMITQSLAILEYLEDTHSEEVPLLPKDPKGRATVRKLSQMIGCDIQPIQNLSVLKKIAKEFGEDQKKGWGNYWINRGFEALEKELQKTSGKYCFGDSVTMADCCLIPQIYNARRFGVDMDKFKTILRIEQECNKLDAFKNAHADNQPDAPKE